MSLRRSRSVVRDHDSRRHALLRLCRAGVLATLSLAIPAAGSRALRAARGRRMGARRDDRGRLAVRRARARRSSVADAAAATTSGSHRWPVVVVPSVASALWNLWALGTLRKRLRDRRRADPRAHTRRRRARGAARQCTRHHRRESKRSGDADGFRYRPRDHSADYFLPSPLMKPLNVSVPTGSWAVRVDLRPVDLHLYRHLRGVRQRPRSRVASRFDSCPFPWRPSHSS